ncbi:thrombospondin type 1 domain-containing protein [Cryptosporidium ryanae]|uniref:thrombospondin type 1 domain-containing protein n=1 Tax=Cryptosporidium ryanae TaxID=515981 RepID=UPI00351A2966|nr:thrombospondin type 1 domain-containing protein [Cryptosporidium ryanae]
MIIIRFLIIVTLLLCSIIFILGRFINKELNKRGLNVLFSVSGPFSFKYFKISVCNQYLRRYNISDMRILFRDVSLGIESWRLKLIIGSLKLNFYVQNNGFENNIEINEEDIKKKSSNNYLENKSVNTENDVGMIRNLMIIVIIQLISRMVQIEFHSIEVKSVLADCNCNNQQKISDGICERCKRKIRYGIVLKLIINSFFLSTNAYIGGVLLNLKLFNAHFTVYPLENTISHKRCCANYIDSKTGELDYNGIKSNGNGVIKYIYNQFRSNIHDDTDKTSSGFPPLLYIKDELNIDIKLMHSISGSNIKIFKLKKMNICTKRLWITIVAEIVCELVYIFHLLTSGKIKTVNQKEKGTVNTNNFLYDTKMLDSSKTDVNSLTDTNGNKNRCDDNYSFYEQVKVNCNVQNPVIMFCDVTETSSGFELILDEFESTLTIKYYKEYYLENEITEINYSDEMDSESLTEFDNMPYGDLNSEGAKYRTKNRKSKRIVKNFKLLLLSRVVTGNSIICSNLGKTNDFSAVTNTLDLNRIKDGNINFDRMFVIEKYKSLLESSKRNPVKLYFHNSIQKMFGFWRENGFYKNLSLFLQLIRFRKYLLKIDNGDLATHLCDYRDDFTNEIPNVPLRIELHKHEVLNSNFIFENNGKLLEMKNNINIDTNFIFYFDIKDLVVQTGNIELSNKELFDLKNKYDITNNHCDDCFIDSFGPNDRYLWKINGEHNCNLNLNNDNKYFALVVKHLKLCNTSLNRALSILFKNLKLFSLKDFTDLEDISFNYLIKSGDSNYKNDFQSINIHKYGCFNQKTKYFTYKKIDYIETSNLFLVRGNEVLINIPWDCKKILLKISQVNGDLSLSYIPIYLYLLSCFVIDSVSLKNNNIHKVYYGVNNKFEENIDYYIKRRINYYSEFNKLKSELLRLVININPMEALNRNIEGWSIPDIMISKSGSKYTWYFDFEDMNVNFYNDFKLIIQYLSLYRCNEYGNYDIFIRNMSVIDSKNNNIVISDKVRLRSDIPFKSIKIESPICLKKQLRRLLDLSLNGDLLLLSILGDQSNVRDNLDDINNGLIHFDSKRFILEIEGLKLLLISNIYYVESLFEYIYKYVYISFYQLFHPPMIIRLGKLLSYSRKHPIVFSCNNIFDFNIKDCSVYFYELNDKLLKNRSNKSTLNNNILFSKDDTYIKSSKINNDNDSEVSFGKDVGWKRITDLNSRFNIPIIDFNFDLLRIHIRTKHVSNTKSSCDGKECYNLPNYLLYKFDDSKLLTDPNYNPFNAFGYIHNFSLNMHNSVKNTYNNVIYARNELNTNIERLFFDIRRAYNINESNLVTYSNLDVSVYSNHKLEVKISNINSYKLYKKLLPLIEMAKNGYNFKFRKNKDTNSNALINKRITNIYFNLGDNIRISISPYTRSSNSQYIDDNSSIDIILEKIDYLLNVEFTGESSAKNVTSALDIQNGINININSIRCDNICSFDKKYSVIYNIVNISRFNLKYDSSFDSGRNIELQLKGVQGDLHASKNILTVDVNNEKLNMASQLTELFFDYDNFHVTMYYCIKCMRYKCKNKSEDASKAEGGISMCDLLGKFDYKLSLILSGMHFKYELFGLIINDIAVNLCNNNISKRLELNITDVFLFVEAYPLRYNAFLLVKENKSVLNKNSHISLVSNFNRKTKVINFLHIKRILFTVNLARNAEDKNTIIIDTVKLSLNMLLLIYFDTFLKVIKCNNGLNNKADKNGRMNVQILHGLKLTLQLKNLLVNTHLNNMDTNSRRINSNMRGNRNTANAIIHNMDYIDDFLSFILTKNPVYSTIKLVDDCFSCNETMNIFNISEMDCIECKYKMNNVLLYSSYIKAEDCYKNNSLYLDNYLRKYRDNHAWGKLTIYSEYKKISIYNESHSINSVKYDKLVKHLLDVNDCLGHNDSDYFWCYSSREDCTNTFKQTILDIESIDLMLILKSNNELELLLKILPLSLYVAASNNLLWSISENEDINKNYSNDSVCLLECSESRDLYSNSIEKSEEKLDRYHLNDRNAYGESDDEEYKDKLVTDYYYEHEATDNIHQLLKTTPIFVNFGINTLKRNQNVKIYLNSLTVSIDSNRVRIINEILNSFNYKTTALKQISPSTISSNNNPNLLLSIASSNTSFSNNLNAVNNASLPPTIYSHNSKNAAANYENSNYCNIGGVNSNLDGRSTNNFGNNVTNSAFRTPSSASFSSCFNENTRTIACANNEGATGHNYCCGSNYYHRSSIMNILNTDCERQKYTKKRDKRPANNKMQNIDDLSHKSINNMLKYEIDKYLMSNPLSYTMIDNIQSQQVFDCDSAHIASNNIQIEFIIDELNIDMFIHGKAFSNFRSTEINIVLLSTRQNDKSTVIEFDASSISLVANRDFFCSNESNGSVQNIASANTSSHNANTSGGGSSNGYTHNSDNNVNAEEKVPVIHPMYIDGHTSQGHGHVLSIRVNMRQIKLLELFNIRILESVVIRVNPIKVNITQCLTSCYYDIFFKTQASLASSGNALANANAGSQNNSNSGDFYSDCSNNCASSQNANGSFNMSNEAKNGSGGIDSIDNVNYNLNNVPAGDIAGNNPASALASRDITEKKILYFNYLRISSILAEVTYRGSVSLNKVLFELSSFTQRRKCRTFKEMIDKYLSFLRRQAARPVISHTFKQIKQSLLPKHFKSIKRNSNYNTHYNYFYGDSHQNGVNNWNLRSVSTNLNASQSDLIDSNYGNEANAQCEKDCCNNRNSRSSLSSNKDDGYFRGSIRDNGISGSNHSNANIGIQSSNNNGSGITNSNNGNLNTGNCNSNSRIDSEYSKFRLLSSTICLLSLLLLLGSAQGGGKRNAIVSSSGLVCEDNPSVSESGYSCSFLARRFGGFLGCEKLLKDLSQDSLPAGIPGNTRVVDACPSSCNMCKECSSGCALWFIGNGVCDPECDNVYCQFDGGDCWKVDCKLSNWSAWSSCSVTCGPGGRITRTRQIVVNPRNGGDSCGALTAEEAGCNSHITCPLSCNVSEWGNWSACSSSCGVGHQMRERSITKAPKDQNLFQCPETRQIRECFRDSCTNKCTLGEYKFKSVISGNPCKDNALNNKGCIERREILTPSYKPNAEDERCRVEEREISCLGFYEECPTQCELSEWSSWSSCSYYPEKLKSYNDENSEASDSESNKLIYKLLKKRTRTSKRKLGYSECKDETEYKECDNSERLEVEALVKCNMGDWSSWSSCSTSCGIGSRLRARWLLSGPEKEDDLLLSDNLINNTENVCGPLFQTKECNDKSCISNACKVSEWSQWSECSAKECNLPGLSKRHRNILSLPKTGYCPVLEESKDCRGRCESGEIRGRSNDNCVLGEWSAWSNCLDDCYTNKSAGNSLLSSHSSGKKRVPNKYRHRMILSNSKGMDGNKVIDCSKEKEYMEKEACKEECNESQLNEYCQVTEWGSWSYCSASCDGGTRRRIRERVNSYSYSSPYHSLSIQSAKTTSSPLSGSNNTSSLHLNKNPGRPLLSRGIGGGNGNNGSHYCPSLLEVEKCNTIPCSIKCELGPWRNKKAVKSSLYPNDEDIEYSGDIVKGCSKKCGIGIVERVRDIITEEDKKDLNHLTRAEKEKIVKTCGPLTDTLKCVSISDEECSFGCQVGNWSNWSKCSSTCGDGYQSRNRVLQVPSYGKKCELATEEIRECNESTCPSSCIVSSWSEWSNCLGGCDERPYRRRERVILEPPTLNQECPSLVETKSNEEIMMLSDLSGSNKALMCPKTEKCPVDCEAGAWSGWSECDVNCGIGIQKRRRSIKSKGTQGGASCPPLEDFRPCARKSCKSDCILSEWSEWEPCSKSCGGGSRARSRSVVSAPNEGAECGVLKEFEPCNEFQCIATRDCEVGQWSAWSPCTATCGGGVKRREREIQVPATGGGRCEYDLKQKVGCNGFRCPDEPCMDRPEAQEVVPCSILKAMFGCQKRLIDVAKANGVSYPDDKPVEARIMDGCPSTCGMCTECSPGCQLRDIGNLHCNQACNNSECRFDDGDCEESIVFKVSCVLPKPSNDIIYQKSISNEGASPHANSENLNDSEVQSGNGNEEEYRKGDVVNIRCKEGMRFGKYTGIPYFKYQCNEGGFIQKIEPKGAPLLHVDGDGIPRIPGCEEDECPYVMIQEAPQLIGSVNTLYKRDNRHSYTYIMYRDIGEPIYITGDQQRVILGPVGTLYLISIESFYPEYNDPSFEKYTLWSLVDIAEQKILQEFVELKLVCLKNPNVINKNEPNLSRYSEKTSVLNPGRTAVEGSSANHPLSDPRNSTDASSNSHLKRPFRFLSQIIETGSDKNLVKINKDGETEALERILGEYDHDGDQYLDKPYTFVMGRKRHCEDQPEVKEQGISCDTLSNMCEINIPNPQNYGLPENSFVWQVCPATCNKCNECSQGCPEWFLGNTVCDRSCNNKECGYDHGDCADGDQSERGVDDRAAENGYNGTVSEHTSEGHEQKTKNGENGTSQGAITFFAGKFRNCKDIPELIDSLASCKALKQACKLKLPLSSSSLEAGLSNSATISQVCPQTCGICEECSPGCPKWFVNNGYCDTNCQNPECNYDGGDCDGYHKVSSLDTCEDDSRLAGDIFERGCDELMDLYGCDAKLERMRSRLNDYGTGEKPSKLSETFKLGTRLKDICKLTCNNCGGAEMVGNGTDNGSRGGNEDNGNEKPFTLLMGKKRYCEDQPEVSQRGMSCKALSSMCNVSIPGAKSYGLPDSTPIWRVCPTTCNKCNECSQGCPEWFLGNTVCDRSCNNKECGYDHGDCADGDQSERGVDSRGSNTGPKRNKYLDDNRYFELLKEKGEKCKDDPKVEELSGFSCEQITSVFDCLTPLKDLPGSKIPSGVPKNALLKHACARSCGLCNSVINDNNSASDKATDARMCRDDVYISHVNGKCRDIMNFSVNISEVCNEPLFERTSLKENSKKVAGNSKFNMNKKVYDHCPKSCGRCTSECDDDPRMLPGECRVAVETANIQGFGCDFPLIQVSPSLLDRFDGLEESEYLLLSDVCARSCNYCNPNYSNGENKVENNSRCSIKSTKHWGPGYQLEYKPVLTGSNKQLQHSSSYSGDGFGGRMSDLAEKELRVSCSPGYSPQNSADEKDSASENDSEYRENNSVRVLCDSKSNIYLLPETLKCQEPHISVMKVTLRIEEASDLDFTSVSSIYIALYSSLPIYQPNGLRIEAVDTKDFEHLLANDNRSSNGDKNNASNECIDQNHQLKSFGINCSMLKPFCNVTLEQLARQFNREIPEGVSADIKVSLACPVTCDGCKEFLAAVNNLKRQGEQNETEAKAQNSNSEIGPLYVLFNVGFFLSSSENREKDFESALRDPVISKRFITNLKTQFMTKGVRLAPKEFEQSRWDSQRLTISNSKLASEDIEGREMKSTFKSHKMVKIRKSEWDRFYSGQRSNTDEDARNLFYKSGVSMPLTKNSRFGVKESVFLKRPLQYLQESYLKCNTGSINNKLLQEIGEYGDITHKAGKKRSESDNNCCNLPHEFRYILLNGGCGSLIYDREPSGVQMDLFCRGTSASKRSCYQIFSDLISKYKNRKGPLCNTIKYAKQLVDSWCYISPESYVSDENPKSDERYCFSSIKETVNVGMDSQEFVSAPLKLFQSRCKFSGCFRSHLSSPLNKVKLKNNIHNGSSVLDILLEETNERWLNLMCTSTSSGAHCQESLSILLERNPIKSRTLLLNPCHSKCFLKIAGKLGSSLQKFGEIADDPQSESLGLLLRHYSRHFCVKNSKGQSCGPLLFAGASLALEASMTRKYTAKGDKYLGDNNNVGARFGLNEESDSHLNISEYSAKGFQSHNKNLSNYCSPGCFYEYIGDGMCDLQCFTESCNWDKGDCLTSSMYPEIYSPLEDLFKECTLDTPQLSSANSGLKKRGRLSGGRISNSCTSTCRARYSILTETLGCCTSVAVDLYQSLTFLDEKMLSRFKNNDLFSLSFSIANHNQWSISRLEQICGISLDRTCSNGNKRIQARMLLGLNYPEDGLSDDPFFGQIISRIISKSLTILESDVKKVFISNNSNNHKYLVDVLVDTGSDDNSDEILTKLRLIDNILKRNEYNVLAKEDNVIGKYSNGRVNDDIIELENNKRRESILNNLEDIWSDELCILDESNKYIRIEGNEKLTKKFLENKNTRCSVNILDITFEKIATLAVTNSTAPSVPWMSTLGFSLSNKDLQPEPCSENSVYIKDAERYKILLKTNFLSKSNDNDGTDKIRSSILQVSSAFENEYDDIDLLSNIISSKTYSHGTRFSISCSNSYLYTTTSGNSPDTLICNNGRWETLTNLRCNKKCNRISLIPNGVKLIDPYSFNGNQYIFHGTKIGVECMDGYKSTTPYVNDYYECIDGRWKKPRLKCMKYCSNINKDSLGSSHIVTGNEYRHQDYRKVYCNKNHYLLPKSGINQMNNDKYSSYKSSFTSVHDMQGIEHSINKGYLILNCNNGTWESEPLVCVKGTLTDYSNIKRGIEVTITHILSIKTLIACIVIVSIILLIITGIWWAWVIRYKKLTDMYDYDQYQRVDNARRILLQISGFEYSNDNTSLERTTLNSDVNNNSSNNSNSNVNVNNDYYGRITSSRNNKNSEKLSHS